ncbi:MAG: hypothetical protein M3033_06520 [Acidobacteriota bacterium]|nr:hypothetical protein [Acidobacteriota bacterium]
MKINKKFPAFVALAVCLAVLSFSANAQKRNPTVKRTTTQAPTSPSLEIKSSAEKVSTQIKNLSRFIYGFGNVAQVIEDLDKDIAAGRASRNAPDLNAKNKRAVLTTIRDFRAGLAALEVEFRTKPALKNYLFQINGITDIAGNAEDQATAGQFIQSGKTLLLVIEKLSDTLVAMP